MEAQHRLWRQFCDLKCRNMSWCGSDQDNIMCTACFPVPSAMCAPLFQSSILDHPKAQKGERIAPKNLEQKKRFVQMLPEIPLKLLSQTIPECRSWSWASPQHSTPLACSLHYGEHRCNIFLENNTI